LSFTHFPFHTNRRLRGSRLFKGADGGVQLLLADVTPRSGEIAEDRDGYALAGRGGSASGGHGGCGEWMDKK